MFLRAPNLTSLITGQEAVELVASLSTSPLMLWRRSRPCLSANFTVILILAKSDFWLTRRAFDVVSSLRHVVLIVHYNHHRNTLRSPDLWSNCDRIARFPL